MAGGSGSGFAGWLRARLAPGSTRGLALTAAVALSALALAAFAILTHDVVSSQGSLRWDAPVERFFVTNRVGWITSVMKATTWLGSSLVLVPVVGAVAAYLIVRRRNLKLAVALAATMAAAIVLSDVAKALVDRPRPPAAVRLERATGASFPSGHVGDAVTASGMLALVFQRGRRAVARVAMWTGVVVVILLVGVSRMYLGVHWLTDVLGSLSGGAALVATTWAVVLATHAAPASPADAPFRSHG